MKDQPLIKHTMLIGFSTAKYLLDDVDVVQITVIMIAALS